MNQPRVGRVVGRPGVGLSGDTSWAKNAEVAEVGQRGEVQTANLIDPLAKRWDVTVLHDLAIPIPNFTANIDHAVVSGRKVLLVDAKVWKPGFYWTFGDTSRRGWTPVPWLDKQTMQMGYNAIVRFLTQRRVEADVATPVTAVWPSSKRGRLSLWAARVPGSKLVAARTLPRTIRRQVGKGLANQQIVAALADLVAANQPDTSRVRHVDEPHPASQSPQSPDGGAPDGARSVPDVPTDLLD